MEKEKGTDSTPKDNVANVTNGTIAVEKDIGPKASGELELVNKGRQKSRVGDHFKKEKIDGKWKEICNYCGKKLDGESRDGTTHLHGHTKICMKRRTRDLKQALLGPKVNIKGKSLANWEYDEGLVRNELACMIAFHEYPMVMVEHYSFRRFMSACCPMYKNISQNTGKSNIFKVYENEKKKLQSLLDNNDSKIAITTDMWIATHQKKGFMTITAHFIDDSWTLQSRIIRFLHVPCPHTAIVLSTALFDSLIDWNIDHKVSALVVDNCSTNDAMVNLLGCKIPPNSLWLDGKLFHVRCSANILNLIVKDGLRIIDRFIENVRESITFWTAIPKRYEKFEEVVSQLKISLTRKIVIDCKTRWNSTYHMLNVAISYENVFMRLEKRDNSFTSYNVAQNICEKLKIFHDAADFFSGTNYPTANLFLLKICQIRLSLRQWSNSPLGYIRNMVARMIDKLDKYWVDFSIVLSIATIIDLRYEFKVLEYNLPPLHGVVTIKGEIEKIKTACYELVAEYSKLYAKKDVLLESNSSMENTFHTTCLSPSGNQSGEIRSFEDFMACEEQSIENVAVEFDHYLKEHLMPRNGDFDLLAWWRTYLKFPVLRLLATDIFAIPMSTVASESAFFCWW